VGKDKATSTIYDMGSFADERKFAAWAGVASGNNESAGKKKDPNADTATHTFESF
jgi:transposase